MSFKRFPHGFSFTFRRFRVAYIRSKGLGTGVFSNVFDSVDRKAIGGTYVHFQAIGRAVQIDC